MESYKILIVDDIFINRVLLTEIVTEIGSEYIEAKNGKEALQVIQNENIDLVLMDIEMPVMNGFETTAAIRKLPNPLCDLPIIAITAHDPHSFFEEYHEAGFNELISKPYTVEKISRLLKKFYG